MNYNAAERKHVRQNAKAAKLADDQRREIVTGIMSVVPGRSWMHDLLSTCNVFSTTFSGNALYGAFNEGQRNIGLRLLTDITSACPDHYVTMMREANERSAASDRRRSPAAGLDGDAGGSVEAGGDIDGDEAWDDRPGGVNWVEG